MTHVSLQYYDAVKVFGMSPLLRDIYRKPIVHDEINYEGNSASRWGQRSGEELSHRFWIALTGGAYATHGEILDNGWIGGGGVLAGTSPGRIGFLRKNVEVGPREGLKPIEQLARCRRAPPPKTDRFPDKKAFMNIPDLRGAWLCACPRRRRARPPPCASTSDSNPCRARFR